MYSAACVPPATGQCALLKAAHSSAVSPSSYREVLLSASCRVQSCFSFDQPRPTLCKETTGVGWCCCVVCWGKHVPATEGGGGGNEKPWEETTWSLHHKSKQTQTMSTWAT